MSEAKRKRTARFNIAAAIDAIRTARAALAGAPGDGCHPSDRAQVCDNNLEEALAILGARICASDAKAHNLANRIADALELEGIARTPKEAERVHEIARSLISDAIQQRKDDE